MIKLLKKEFKLALHPTNVIFLGLSAMLLIPNYPYYVTFFYASLALFFMCLSGRENHDMEYSLTLPVRKRDLVRARIGFAVAIEFLQAVIAVPFAILRQRVIPVGNAVGMDANIAFFGLAFIMLGVFNLIFFARYYKAPAKVGAAFVVGSVAEFLIMAVLETLTHIVPFMRDKLDTPDPQFIAEKLLMLALGLVIYAILTGLTLRICEKRFDKLDI